MAAARADGRMYAGQALGVSGGRAVGRDALGPVICGWVREECAPEEKG
jgi:hypothetical protein